MVGTILNICLMFFNIVLMSLSEISGVDDVFLFSISAFLLLHLVTPV